jgi:hypothetical protein
MIVLPLDVSMVAALSALARTWGVRASLGIVTASQKALILE